MNKLVLISCYIGEFPPYFKLFLESCKWNPLIDWLIFSDFPPPNKMQLSENVMIKDITLARIRELAFKRIGKWINLDRPYKLCDFKPAYGVLFSEYISGYDYWGHCDIDVIWGQLQNRIMPLLDKGFDRYFKYGHLSIYKNSAFVNEVFKLSYSGLGYKKVFSTSISCGFDEMRGTWLLAKENGLKIYHEDILFDLKRPGWEHSLQSYTSKNYSEQCFLVKNKHIVHFFINEAGECKSEEQAYIHFQKRNLIINSDTLNSDFQITENQIIRISEAEPIELCFKRNKVRKQKKVFILYKLCRMYFATFNYKFLKLSNMLTPQS